jgi:RNA polymerase sigma factor (sigma-70 family)
MTAPVWDRTDRRRLVGLCATISGDPDAAEDLAQETLYEAWRNAHKLVDVSGAERWVNAIARNVCRRWAQSQAAHHRRVQALPANEDLTDDLRLELDLDRTELAELLDRALARLPESTRAVLAARYFEESSHSEIAARLGLSPDAVSMRVARGKVMLRHVLETDLRSEIEPHIGRSLRTDITRTTSVWCTGCGGERLEMIVSTPAGFVSFRCPRCTPESAGRTHAFDMTNPAFARLLAPVSRPTAILDRASRWVDHYFLATDATPRPVRRNACTRCDRPVLVRRYRREGPEVPGALEVGLYTRCAACGEQVSSSLAGLALAHPEVREFRRGQPRLTLVPLRSTEAHGRAALVVGYRVPGGRAAVDVVFDEQRYSVLAVHTVAG